jgi:hypothetical protein
LCLIGPVECKVWTCLAWAVERDEHVAFWCSTSSRPSSRLAGPQLPSSAGSTCSVFWCHLSWQRTSEVSTRSDDWRGSARSDQRLAKSCRLPSGGCAHLLLVSRRRPVAQLRPAVRRCGADAVRRVRHSKGAGLGPEPGHGGAARHGDGNRRRHVARCPCRRDSNRVLRADLYPVAALAVRRWWLQAVSCTFPNRDNDCRGSLCFGRSARCREASEQAKAHGGVLGSHFGAVNAVARARLWKGLSIVLTATQPKAFVRLGCGKRG